jgi:hypothetical protein
LASSKIATLDDALGLVREAQVVMEASALPGVPSFVEAVVGTKVKGSWWGHPQGKKIFNLGEAVADSGEVLMCKLLGGKRTWVHRDSWPLVLRVVLDEAWVAQRSSDLSAAARKLLREVEETQKVVAPPPAPTAALEKAMLAHVMSEHTPSGKHVKVATAWKAWARSVGAEAAASSLPAALEKLRQRAGGNPTALD